MHKLEGLLLAQTRSLATSPAAIGSQATFVVYCWYTLLKPATGRAHRISPRPTLFSLFSLPLTNRATPGGEGDPLSLMKLPLERWQRSVRIPSLG